MCRFLLTKSKNKIKPEKILVKFATVAKESRAFDGDWQGDGWGVSWLDTNNNWQVKKSLKPVWEDQALFSEIPESRLFALHARSASFPKHKGLIEFNEPFVNKDYAYVFNGFLKKVRFPKNIPGEIGAQKIYYLLIGLLKKNMPLMAFEKLKKLLEKNVLDLQACNIGLCDKQNIYALNLYNRHPEYYQLYYFNTPNFKLICSEKLDGYNFTTMKLGLPLVF